ncbi:MAG: hypothetical protein S4CHLAM20_15580 [Chlamydiia bacterium]|nr:hypothetical protein [Chlamydiia bacterium]
MNLKLRTSNTDPRAINRTLFYKPFNPKVNLAIEDPLLLVSNEAVQQEGLSCTRTFASNSPLSQKAAEFLNQKKTLETLYSKKTHVENTLILSHQEDVLSSLENSFLSSQVFLVPDTITSPISQSKTIYFSYDNLFSIIDIINNKNLDHTPILYLPKICPTHGRIDYKQIETLKQSIDIFLIVEDHYTFGLEGLTGVGTKRESSLINLNITHIPKNFGKMLTLISGDINLLDRLLEYSFSKSALFPPAAYIGMFSKALTLLDSLKIQRDNIDSFAQKVEKTFPNQCKVYKPLIIFTFNSNDEKEHFYKSLVDNGFLLPSSFSSNEAKLIFFINHELDETCIHHFQKAFDSFPKQVICESI